jgi:hypothetical protein
MTGTLLLKLRKSTCPAGYWTAVVLSFVCFVAVVTALPLEEEGVYQQPAAKAATDPD